MNGRHILSSGCSGEGKQALSFPVSGVCLSAHRAPGVSPGRLFCIRKGGSATAGIPGRTFLPGLMFLPCSSTQKCRLLRLFGIGVVGLWSREGCGVGPNLHSVVTSTYCSVSYCRHSKQDSSVSGLTSLSWAPSAGIFHDIQVISSHAKASPSTTGNLLPTLGDEY